MHQELRERESTSEVNVVLFYPSKLIQDTRRHWEVNAVRDTKSRTKGDVILKAEARPRRCVVFALRDKA